MTAGYIDPNATPDQKLSRILPLTTTSGLQGSVAEDFEAFRRDLGPGDCVAVISAAGECIWTSHAARSLEDLYGGLLQALQATKGGGGDVAMSDGG